MPVSLKNNLAKFYLRDFENKLEKPPHHFSVTLSILASDNDPMHDSVLVERWTFNIKMKPNDIGQMFLKNSQGKNHSEEDLLELQKHHL